MNADQRKAKEFLTQVVEQAPVATLISNGERNTFRRLVEPEEHSAD